MRRFITVGLLSDPEARVIVFGLVLNGLGALTIVFAYLRGRWSRSPIGLTPELAVAAVLELVGALIVFSVLGKLLLGGLKKALAPFTDPEDHV
jgi:hypothetical protein